MGGRERGMKGCYFGVWMGGICESCLLSMLVGMGSHWCINDFNR